MAQLPKTKARLSTSAKFFVSPDDIAETSTLNIASLANLKAIGSVERFAEANPRATDPRREINYDDPGEILERIPQLVERTLTIVKAVLYTQDLLNMFGTSDFVDIVDQNKPFTIVKVETAPADSGVPNKATVYTGCWFHDNPKEYNITRELKMIQEATIGYTKRFVASVTA